MIRLLFTASTVACLLAACNGGTGAAGKDSTAAAGDTGSATAAAPTSDTAWTPLFNGNSLAGWHSYGKAAPSATWTADSNTIHLKPADGGGDLLTNEEYGDFDLKLEWKISKNGNSGILFYVNEDTAKYSETYFTGPEMQVLDNNGHPDAKIIKHRAGDLYDMITSAPETVKPVGEWNAAEIKSEDNKLTFFLNGAQVLSTSLWDDSWKKLVAGSKFKQWPDFGTFKKGHIALQDHGNEVWYRNVMIRKL